MEECESRCATAVIKSCLRRLAESDFQKADSGSLILVNVHTVPILHAGAWPQFRIQSNDCAAKAGLKHTVCELSDPGVCCRLDVSFSGLCQDEGGAIHEILRELESQCLSEISAMLSGEISGEELGDLFFDCVDTEIKFYQWGGGRLLGTWTWMWSFLVNGDCNVGVKKNKPWWDYSNTVMIKKGIISMWQFAESPKLIALYLYKFRTYISRRLCEIHLTWTKHYNDFQAQSNRFCISPALSVSVITIRTSPAVV